MKRLVDDDILLNAVYDMENAASILQLAEGCLAPGNREAGNAIMGVIAFLRLSAEKLSDIAESSERYNEEASESVDRNAA